jgi:hypothetical protein
VHNPHQAAYQALQAMPARPSGVSIEIVFLSRTADPRVPATIPRKARLVCGSSSSWGPAHSSDDVFRLSTNAQRSHWILWHGYFDDNEYMKWIHQPAAICRYSRLPPRTAAFHMLVELLRAHSCFAQILSCISAGILTESEIHLAREMARAQTN